jgi:hypothetical protein
VDCDLLNNAGQGPVLSATVTVLAVDTCAAQSGAGANFGKAGAATVVDPDLLTGWGVRTHDYQTEVTLQHEILPRVSADISYIHRTFHGFMVTDLIGRNFKTDYVNYTINAPVDERLPGGGGYPITVYLNNSTAATQNNLKREESVGVDGKERDAYYDGVNFNINARMRSGLFVSFGTQTGRRVDDRCNVVTNFNNGGTGPNPRDCKAVRAVRDDDPRSRQLHRSEDRRARQRDGALGVAAADRGQLDRAEQHDPDAARRHAPAGLLATGNSTIDLTDSEHLLFADNRRTQVDMRFAKIVRFGRTRADIGVDLWNLFNTNYATGYAGTYTARTAVYTGRTRHPSTRRGSCD